ncbi:MAG TPA: hypothetical protein VGS19_15060 [Streptosporangiaceae bacterium]|nr:hypothetical protein [Streptosporangiaceae bacterium]
MIIEQARQPEIAGDVREFFTSHRGAFGAMNLLDHHLPSDARIAELVRNVMTVDYAISRVLEVPDYHSYLDRFSADSMGACGDTGMPGDSGGTYRDHLIDLEDMTGAALADAVTTAAADSMETFNLFVPKQCNLSCRGCYAAAVPVTARPFDDGLVAGFTSGALSVIEQARACGARTVYTSGDGEPTIFPRFFDLLEAIRERGMQWLFFTAGLAFSSEEAARRVWQDAAAHLQGPSRDRIAQRLSALERDGAPDPTVRALTAELAEFRENIEVYHSIWRASGRENTEVRRPQTGEYRYVRVPSRDTTLELPSSLLAFMDEVFTGDLRGRLGIEMPVSDIGAADAADVAAFVVDNGLRSYFEPTILTGRNRIGDLGEAPPDVLHQLSPLLVRAKCGFRNIHQPTVKYVQDHAGTGFVASPGMGVDTADLGSLGVLEPLRIGDSAGGFFAAAHAPLMVYANYVHSEGCKCNSFAARLKEDRAGLARSWQQISSCLDPARISLPELAVTLRAADGG